MLGLEARTLIGGTGEFYGHKPKRDNVNGRLLD